VPKVLALAIAAAGVFALSSPHIQPMPGCALVLRRLVADGTLSDLRRPDFSDCSTLVKDFYESREYMPAWTHQGELTGQANAIIQILESANMKGLDSADYDAGLWSGRLGTLRQQHGIHNLGRFDLALTVSLIRYVSDVSRGRANPALFASRLDMERHKSEIRCMLGRLIGAIDVSKLLSGIEPAYPGYQRTLAALRHYLAIAEADDGQLLPGVDKPVDPGAEYEGVARLIWLLRRLGDLPADAALANTRNVYDGALPVAVKRFQVRHGLEPDGRIGKDTLAELNTPLRHRVRQLQLTLERYRWVQDRFRRPRIIVNIPEFRLRGLNDAYTPEIESKVVVGRAFRHNTPVFGAEMKHVIFRPYWNVPNSILRAELIPKLRRDNTYLVRDNYEILDCQGAIVTRGAVNDGILAQLNAGELKIRQIPGPANALGRVKFVFPNNHNVYLHDTPATELFSKARRDFSHGCIRVENAASLAEWVLRQKPEWTRERIAEAMEGTETVQVNLEVPIPVLIVYATAIVLQTGEVRFFPDIYGHDADLGRLLSSGYSQ
jgi:murein L,D-transpeptidase YcbB/YkuD